jgi:hypothetical protein
MQNAREYVNTEHDIKPEDITFEMQQKIRGLIRTE